MTAPMTHHAPQRRTRQAPKPKVATSIVPESSVTAAPAIAPPIDAERRHAMISEAAYYLAEQRTFCPGHELEDWLTAEREIDCALGSSQPDSGCGT